jgi:hypothetical protein
VQAIRSVVSHRKKEFLWKQNPNTVPKTGKPPLGGPKGAFAEGKVNLSLDQYAAGNFLRLRRSE